MLISPPGTITGMNLGGIHERYEGVLEIFKKKNCSLAQAMRDFDVPRNTIRDYIGMCELKIIDLEKYLGITAGKRSKRKGINKKHIITLPGSLKWVQGPVKQA